MRRMGLIAVALAAVLAGGCNKIDKRAADNSAIGTAGRADGVSAGDKDFVKDVSAMNMAEIELSQTALQKSASPDVQKFAQMMVDDHTGAGDKLRTVASEHQIETAAQIDDKHRDLRDKLAAKQGLDFDKDYMDAMVDGHNDLLDKLESRIDKDTLSKFKASYVGKDTAKVEAVTVTAEKSDDPIKMAVNEWAAQTYPVAYAHREAAKTLRDAVKKRTTN